MATLPINLEVEGAAVGPLLILLRKTPGIVKMTIPDLLSSDATSAPQPSRQPRGGKSTAAQAVIALLIRKNGEPISITEINQLVGGSKSYGYGVVHQLAKNGAVKSVGRGVYALTDNAARELLNGAGTAGADAQEVRMLPGPKGKTKVAKKKLAKAANGKGKKAPRGAPMLAIRNAIITHGPLRPIEFTQHLDGSGISVKGMSGMLFRAKRDGIIKRNKDGQYELTAKGMKLPETLTTQPVAQEG